MNNLPWSTISKPATGYLWKRHADANMHAFWWGKDSLGNPVLLFQLADGDYTATFLKSRPFVAGLTVDIVSVENGSFQGLIISLKTPDADIFHQLCLMLIKVAEDTSSEEQAVKSVLSHLDRWKDFLAAAKKDLLSSEQIRGLFAEVVVINRLIDDYSKGPAEIMAAWGGPFGRPQDFHFPEGFIEVKSVGGSQGNLVSISSEYQLDVDNEVLVLIAVELTEDDTKVPLHSLNQLVNATASRLDAASARVFQERLTLVGYVYRPEYDVPLLGVINLDTYNVDDQFPSILARHLTPGISGVKYKVDLGTASSSRINRLDFWSDKADV